LLNIKIISKTGGSLDQIVVQIAIQKSILMIFIIALSYYTIFPFQLGKMAMKIGYARVSTADQHLRMQEDALKSEGCEQIFHDIASGVKTERAGLDEALTHLRKKDVLVVWKLDRLGRSVQHLIETIKKLNERGIGFKSLQENIDTTTSGGKLIFHIFSALAEFERDLIKERTNAGLKAARARGRLGGRPPLLKSDEVKKMLKYYDEQKITVDEICKIFNVSRPSFYNYLNKRKTAIQLA